MTVSVNRLSGSRFCEIIEHKGWVLKRINGSHHIYMKTGLNIHVSVPVHGNKSLKIGLQKHLMKAAGVDDKDL